MSNIYNLYINQNLRFPSPLSNAISVTNATLSIFELGKIVSFWVILRYGY